MPIKSKDPLVTCVITTKNEEHNVPNIMKSIKAQTYKNIETILVDNQSDDRTKQVARKLGAKVFDKAPERSAQRNFGMITKSKGKYVMFIDCDMIFSPNLVQEAVLEMEEGGHVALYIPEIVLGASFWSKVRRFERTFYDGTVIDCARMFKKSVFKKVKGFDLRMCGPEDWDIDKKMRKEGEVGLLKAPEKIGRWSMRKFVEKKGVNPNRHGVAIYHNEAEFNVKKYLEKKGYYATTFDIYIKKWGMNDPDLKKQLGLKYRFFGVFLERGKWLKLVAHPFLTLGMMYLRFMVGVKFITRKKKGKVESPYKTKK